MTDAPLLDKNDNVIRLDDLKNEITLKKKLKEEKIVQGWVTVITREYIMEKIVQAEIARKKYTHLIVERGDPLLSLDVYKRYFIEDKIRAFLEPSMTVYGYIYDANDEFVIEISWQPVDDRCTIL